MRCQLGELLGLHGSASPELSSCTEREADNKAGPALTSLSVECRWSDTIHRHWGQSQGYVLTGNTPRYGL